MEFLSKYTGCLSKHLDCLSKFQLDLAPGWQTVGALVLLSTGGLFVACKALTLVRVFLSLFILPGKPVCIELVINGSLN